MTISLRTHRAGRISAAEQGALYKALLETTDTGYVILDGCGKVLDANAEYVRLSGHKKLNDILGRNILEWTSEREKDKNAEAVRNCMESGLIRNLEIDYVDRHGRTTPIEINATAIRDKKKLRILSLCRDISERRRVENALKTSEISLQRQKALLEQKNIALKELIEQVGMEKVRIKDNVLRTVERVLLPTMRKIGTKPAQDSKYMKLFEHHLRELTSSYAGFITSTNHRLTPHEIEICNMVKSGMPSKDIAALLSISRQTVEKHRKNIRRKLGVSGKKVNLASLLLTS